MKMRKSIVGVLFVGAFWSLFFIVIFYGGSN